MEDEMENEKKTRKKRNQEIKTGKRIEQNKFQETLLKSTTESGKKDNSINRKATPLNDTTSTTSSTLSNSLRSRKTKPNKKQHKKLN